MKKEKELVEREVEIRKKEEVEKERLEKTKKDEGKKMLNEIMREQQRKMKEIEAQIEAMIKRSQDTNNILWSIMEGQKAL